jgi:hypothetical protein
MSSNFFSEGYRLVDQVRTIGDNLETKAAAVALNLQNAQSETSSIMSSMENVISQLKGRVLELTRIYHSMVAENAQSNQQIQMLESQVDTNQKVVKEAETLASLRKEQADELSRKHLGNYHSSWLGLWRPLSEQSRTGLFVASIFFGLLAITLIVLYGKQFLPGAVLAYFGITGIQNESLNLNAIAGSYVGGKRRKE